MRLSSGGDSQGSSGVVLVLVRHGVGDFVFRRGLSMHFLLVEIVACRLVVLLLVGSVCGGTFFVCAMLSLVLLDSQRRCP